MRQTITIFVSILVGAAAFAVFAWLFPETHIDPFTPPGRAQEAGGGRDGTPGGITPKPPSGDSLTRLAGVGPAAGPAQWHRFFQPVAAAAGSFELGGATIRLKGIQPTDPGRECAAGEEQWPCGRVALTSLRNMLRGRAIECYWGGDEGDAPEEAPCRVGATDLSLWLASNGWADVAPDASDAIREAARQAKCDGLGLWRGMSGSCRQG